jgi:hypothetical protein
METYGGPPPILTSAPDGGEWSVSRLGRFTIGKRAPATHWIGGWVAEPIWTLWSTENSLALVGNRTPAVSIPAEVSRLLSGEGTSVKVRLFCGARWSFGCAENLMKSTRVVGSMCLWMCAPEFAYTCRVRLICCRRRETNNKIGCVY